MDDSGLVCSSTYLVRMWLVDAEAHSVVCLGEHLVRQDEE
jgi:hypothetical protein